MPDLQDKFIEGAGTNLVGAYLEAGVPNITGYFGPVATGGWYVGGAFYNYNVAKGTIKEDGSADRTVGFQASRSSDVYGKSATVQPASVVMNYIVKY